MVDRAEDGPDWRLLIRNDEKRRKVAKRILSKYCNPPDLQEVALKTVLVQAELLCANWA